MPQTLLWLHPQSSSVGPFRNMLQNVSRVEGKVLQYRAVEARLLLMDYSHSSKKLCGDSIGRNAGIRKDGARR